LIVRDACVDALVVARVMQQQWRVGWLSVDLNNSTDPFLGE
jgi:hypothetical protein